MDIPNSSGFFGGAKDFPVGPIGSAIANPTRQTGIKQRWAEHKSWAEDKNYAEHNRGSSKEPNTLKPPLQKVLLPPSNMTHNFLSTPTNNEHRLSWIA